jgi:DME family drug/metabolite transporter
MERRQSCRLAFDDIGGISSRQSRSMMTTRTLASDAARGRLLIVAAAVLWSTSGALTKILTQDTFAGLNVPPLAPLRFAGKDLQVQIACYRVLIAGLVLLPAVRPRDVRVRPVMFLMLAFFTTMNLTFISAQALGTAANAVLLQYSAPLWMYLASVLWLGEKADRRSAWSLGFGMAGIGLIVGGGWQEGELLVVGIALASGIFYAGVVICLRYLRDLSPAWLTAWNHLLAGLVLLPLIVTLPPPSPAQYAVLFVFGTLQMGLPYLLMARGLRSVSAQEAGTLTLLEPILNPVWAYLVSPATEVPHPFTIAGGVVILGALVWRYWPTRPVSAPGDSPAAPIPTPGR